VGTTGKRALHSATEVGHVVDRRLGGIGGKSAAAVGGAVALLGIGTDTAESSTTESVPVVERRSELAELRIDSLRDGEGRHLKFKACALVCGHRVAISNRWAKKVLGGRVSTEREAELWAYCRNLAKIGAAHARATGQPYGVTVGVSTRHVRAPPRLQSADAALQHAGAIAVTRHALVPLAHFLMLSHTLPLVPPSGKFFSLDTLASEATAAEVDALATTVVSPAHGDGGLGGLGLTTPEADLSFIAPLLQCRDPAACKDAFFKAVPMLQKVLSTVHKARESELDDAEATRIAALIANLWADVLDAGGGPTSVVAGAGNNRFK